MRFRTMVIALVAAAAAALALAGCSATASTYEPPTPTAKVSSSAIGEDGVLRVGVNAERSPLAGMVSNKIVGIDVDMAAAIADELGLKLSIVDVGSDPEGALKDGDVDIVLGIDKGTTTAAFWKSESYLSTGIALFAASKGAAVPTASTGAKFAAQVSSTSAWAVMNEFGDTSLTSTTNLGEAFSALEAGTVQYVAADAVIGTFFANSNGTDASIIALMQQPSGYCVGVLDSNTELKTAVSDAVSALVGNGVSDIIEKKWLGGEIDLSSVPKTEGATKGTTSTDDQTTAASDVVSAVVAASGASGVSTAASNAVTA